MGEISTLDDEQRREVANSLKRAGIALAGEILPLLITGVQSAIQEYRNTPEEESESETIDALKRLFDLANDPDRPIGQIRAAISNLPPRALRKFTTKAGSVLSLAYPSLEYDGDMRTLAKRAEPELLRHLAATLAFTGAEPVPGQSRGGGRRDSARWVPRIGNYARGSAAQKPKTGRPRNVRELELVGRLAHEWERATGQFPKLGRSDKRGFGSLVHAVFQWVGLSQAMATTSLRAFAREMKEWDQPARID